MIVVCLQVIFCGEIVAMSSTKPYQFEPKRSRSDSTARRPTVQPEDGGGGDANTDSSTRMTDTRWCGCEYRLIEPLD